MSNESNSCETACAFTPPGAHRLASSHSAAPNHRKWRGISFPARWSHGHASARSRDRAHPAPATSLQPSSGCCLESHQRLAGSHGAQRGFFVAVAKDSSEVVIESVLRLLFEFQAMSGARVQCAEFSVHILRAASC